MKIIAFDDLFAGDSLAAARRDWPAADWKGWISNDGRQPQKKVSNLSEPLPPACAALLTRVAMLPVSQWFQGDGELIPDIGLWGSGLHEIGPGLGLGRHLDAEVHGRLGVRRVLSAVLWVHGEWRHEWGGELTFDSGASIVPAPGRLVVFDSRTEWHRVAQVSCPPGVSRKSLAIFWYSAKVVVRSALPRAHFEEAR